MKKTILAFTMLLSAGASVMAQNNDIEKSKPVQYHFITNNIPSDWNYPLLGFVNNVDGNHASVQIGIVNTTSGIFSGVQTAIINTVGVNTTGLQSGLFNTVGGKVSGLQNGFINTVGASVYGIQDGFINTVGQSVYGVQNGLINTVGNEVVGFQAGFLNTAQKITGLQCGFINTAKTLKGLQLGFINSVDKVEKGLPIGFLSFVKAVGYKAVELSYNNTYPVNVAFKTGIREFYTYPVIAYDYRLASDRLAVGYGIGSNLDISNHLFINPEMEGVQQVSLDFNHYSTLRCNLGYNISNNFEIVAGPSLVWQFKINAADFHQNYTEWDTSIISLNKLSAGFNLALRYKF